MKVHSENNMFYSRVRYSCWNVYNIVSGWITWLEIFKEDIPSAALSLTSTGWLQIIQVSIATNLSREVKQLIAIFCEAKTIIWVSRNQIVSAVAKLFGMRIRRKFSLHSLIESLDTRVGLGGGGGRRVHIRYNTKKQQRCHLKCYRRPSLFEQSLPSHIIVA